SNWLNRFNKNISVFVTSAQKEYDSIVNGPYYYQSNQILLSGLPRYDFLEKGSSKGKLILAPTYRKNLARLNTNKNGVRPYDSEFKKSEYRNFYNRFMNDERITALMNEYDMQG